MDTLPTPYYQDDRATIYQGDCIEIMPLLPQVDIVFTDPPYCSGGMYRGDRVNTCRNKYQNSNVVKRYHEFSGEARDQRQFMAYMAHVLRTPPIAAGGIVASFIDWRNLATLWDSFGMAGIVTRGIAAWDKTEGVRPSLGRPRQQVEFIIWGTNGPRPCKGVTIPGCWREYLAGSKRVHMTQKPVSIATDFCRLISPGETVLDPFMGSGSTGVACIQTGRRFVGIEMEEEYCAIAAARLRQARTTP